MGLPATHVDIMSTPHSRTSRSSSYIPLGNIHYSYADNLLDELMIRYNSGESSSFSDPSSASGSGGGSDSAQLNVYPVRSAELLSLTGDVSDSVAAAYAGHGSNTTDTQSVSEMGMFPDSLLTLQSRNNVSEVSTSCVAPEESHQSDTSVLVQGRVVVGAYQGDANVNRQSVGQNSCSKCSMINCQCNNSLYDSAQSHSSDGSSGPELRNIFAAYVPTDHQHCVRENMLPDRKPRNDETPESSDIIEPPPAFRGLVLSLASSSSALIAPHLRLREISPMSNADSHPSYTTDNNISRQYDVTSSTDSSTTASSSSDGYPHSTTTTTSSENQPDWDTEQELQSRQQYYSDFTIDRQHRISSTPQLAQNHQMAQTTLEVNGEMITRYVEGAEKMDIFQRIAAMPIKSCSTTPTTPAIEESSSGASTLRKTKRSMQSDTKMTSSRGSARCNSHPLFHSTMIMEPGSSDINSNNRNEADRSSVYAWSLEEDGENIDLEESYLRSCKRPRQCCKLHDVSGHQHPSLPRPLNSHVLSYSSNKHQRPVKKLPKSSRRVLNFSSSPHLSDMVSTIEPVSGQRSLPDLESSTTSTSSETFCKRQWLRSIPRTSTQRDLHSRHYSTDKTDIGKCDTLWVHPCPNSVTSDTENSPSLMERPPVPGKSSTSDSGAGGNGPVIPRAPKTQEIGATALTVNRSPNSLASSGMFAPYNSYSSPTSLISHCGQTSVTSSPSSSDKFSCFPSISPPKPVDSVFKVPTMPMNPALRRQQTGSLHITKSLTTSLGQPEPVTRQKNVSPVSSPREYKFKDKKALLRRIKKFSHHFYKKDKCSDSDSTEIKTLANL